MLIALSASTGQTRSLKGCHHLRYGVEDCPDDRGITSFMSLFTSILFSCIRCQHYRISVDLRSKIPKTQISKSCIEGTVATCVMASAMEGQHRSPMNCDSARNLKFEIRISEWVVRRNGRAFTLSCLVSIPCTIACRLRL